MVHVFFCFNIASGDENDCVMGTVGSYLQAVMYCCSALIS